MGENGFIVVRCDEALEEIWTFAAAGLVVLVIVDELRIGESGRFHLFEKSVQLMRAKHNYLNIKIGMLTNN